MLRDNTDASRRDVLKTATGAAAATGLMGVAGATDATTRMNIGFSSESGREAATSAGEEVIHDFNFDAVTVRADPAAVRGLENRSDIRYVEEDGEMEALAQELPWGIDRVDAEVAHANGETGNGADIAIIDTGIDDDHPDLQANVG
ncbi:MAG: peptidase S8, partial [Halolamina sp.]